VKRDPAYHLIEFSPLRLVFSFVRLAIPTGNALFDLRRIAEKTKQKRSNIEKNRACAMRALR
jgi:hypothetical protein